MGKNVITLKKPSQTHVSFEKNVMVYPHKDEWEKNICRKSWIFPKALKIEKLKVDAIMSLIVEHFDRWMAL